MGNESASSRTVFRSALMCLPLLLLVSVFACWRQVEDRPSEKPQTPAAQEPTRPKHHPAKQSPGKVVELPRPWDKFDSMPSVRALVMSADRRRIASTDSFPDSHRPDEITIWNLETRKGQLRLQGTSGRITGLAFSPDGKRIVAACPTSNVAKIWNVETGNETLTLRPRDRVYQSVPGSRADVSQVL